MRLQDWKNVEGTCVPGRSYSIQELLARTVRGERLPGLDSANFYDNSPVVDWRDKNSRKKAMKEIEGEMTKSESHPFFENDSDMVEAGAYVHEIDDKYDL